MGQKPGSQSNPRRGRRAALIAGITGCLLLAPVLFTVYIHDAKPPLDQGGELGSAEPFLTMTTAGDPLGRYDLTGRVAVILVEGRDANSAKISRQAANLARWVQSQLTYTGDVAGSPVRLIVATEQANNYPAPWITIPAEPSPDPGTLVPASWQASEQTEPMLVVIDQQHQFRLLMPLSQVVAAESDRPVAGLRQLLSKLIVNHHLFEYLTQRTTMQ